MKILVSTKHGPLNSKPIFEAFIHSLKSSGEQVFVDENIEADVCVIWSVLWFGRMSGYRNIFHQYRNKNRPVVVLEVGGLRRNQSFKIGINGVNRKADFANQNYDSARWHKFDHEIKPWRDNGNEIIILGQHDRSEQWAGMPAMSKWIEQQILEIRKHTDRPIHVRPHPRNQIGLNLGKFDNVFLKRPIFDRSTIDDTDFKKHLSNAFAIVNHSSNPAIESVLNGVPVFVSADSLCYEVGNKDYSTLKNPIKPDREKWAHKISYTEWFPDEIKSGLPWSRLKKRLKEKYL